MTNKVTAFIMYNTGEFRFISIDPDYENLLKVLGLSFDDYISDEKVKICGTEYTIYSKMMNHEPSSRVTAYNQNYNTFMLNTFLIIRENKNHCFLSMTTSHMNDIKSRLVFSDMKKVRLIGNDYIKNKIMLMFD